jgi:hypothetical protein
MVSIPALWLPIVLSAVFVFVASAVIHMFLGYHNSDFRKVPNEEKVLEAMRKEEIAPGDYMFPRAASHKDAQTPEMIEKFKKGPIGLLTVLPSGPPTMGKQLVQWLVYCLAVSAAAAYLGGRALGPGAPYLAVFRFTGTAAFLAYTSAHFAQSIWFGRAWSTTFKDAFDGLVYGLLTGGAFGWLWPNG